MPSHLVRILIVAACTWLQTFATHADTTVSIDNDLFSGSGQDRDYTGGIRLTFRSNYDLSWQAGLLQFTPDNLEQAGTTPGERPYASLLFVARSKETYYANAITRRTISGGILGLPIANSLQRAIHRATGSEQPVGYKDQISDGGEPTVRLGWARYTPLLEDSFRFRNFNVVAESTASVGYLTDVSIGVGFNYNRQPHYWGDGRYHFQSQLDEPTSLAVSGIFGGVRLRGIAYNALLQGQFRNSPSRLPSSEVRHLVAEAWLGFARSYRGVRVSYTLHATSPEYKRGNVQVWGALSVSKDIGLR